MYSRFHHIRPSSAPIAVRSCFGGAALYRYGAIKDGGARYTGSVFGVNPHAPKAWWWSKPVEEMHEQVG